MVGGIGIVISAQWLVDLSHSGTKRAFHIAERSACDYAYNQHVRLLLRVLVGLLSTKLTRVGEPTLL